MNNGAISKELEYLIEEKKITYKLSISTIDRETRKKYNITKQNVKQK